MIIEVRRHRILFLDTPAMEIAAYMMTHFKTAGPFTKEYGADGGGTFLYDALAFDTPDHAEKAASFLTQMRFEKRN